MVLGIRESLKKSLEKKKDSDDTIEAITAEDIGKFPATNIAEALAQVPGITLDRVLGSDAARQHRRHRSEPESELPRRPSGGAGDLALRRFAESRFQLLAAGPRSAGFTGNLQDAGSESARGQPRRHDHDATVQPLDVASNTLSGSVGYNYNTWSTTANPMHRFSTAGKTTTNLRHRHRSQHYEQITDRQGDRDLRLQPGFVLRSVQPGDCRRSRRRNDQEHGPRAERIQCANFQQNEKRDSGFSNIQWKPTDQLEFDLGLMDMRDNLNNYNQSIYPFWAWTNSTVAGVQSFTPGPGGVISGGTNCDPHTTPTCPGVAATVFDNNARTATIETRGGGFQGHLQRRRLEAELQTGVSTSHDDITQAFIEPVYFGGYQLVTSTMVSRTPIRPPRKTRRTGPVTTSTATTPAFRTTRRTTTHSSTSPRNWAASSTS